MALQKLLFLLLLLLSPKSSVVHIDAGLWTRNINSPWPEEINRRLTVSFTELHLLRQKIPTKPAY